MPTAWETTREFYFMRSWCAQSQAFVLKKLRPSCVPGTLRNENRFFFQLRTRLGPKRLPGILYGVVSGETKHSPRDEVSEPITGTGQQGRASPGNQCGDSGRNVVETFPQTDASLDAPFPLAVV